MTPNDTSELYLRFARRSMVVLVGLFVALGALGVSVAVEPDGAAGRWLQRMSWLLPVAIVVAFAALRATLPGRGFDPRSPEARALDADEWRRASFERARRIAFPSVLVAQVPLALLLRNVPSPRAVAAMAATTIALGAALVGGLFLFFDRDERDERDEAQDG